jgi:hypothetical protein
LNHTTHIHIFIYEQDEIDANNIKYIKEGKDIPVMDLGGP